MSKTSALALGCQLSLGVADRDPRDIERIAQLEVQVGARDARIAELEGKLEGLTQLVMSLKEQLNRNSGNSHLRVPRACRSNIARRRASSSTSARRTGTRCFT